MKIGNKEISRRKVVVLAVVAAAAVLVALAAPYTMVGAPGDGVVKLRKGSSVEAVRDSIAAQVDVAFADRVVTLLNLIGCDVSERQGAYVVNKGDSPLRLVRMLRNGSSSGIKFTFNNIRTADEWTTLVGEKFMMTKDEMSKALSDPKLCAKYGMTPETMVGMLLPDSYEFYWDITPEQMLDHMKEYYDKFWTEGRQSKAKNLGLTPMEIEIIASIVEEETAKADERGKVARLYLNRYQSGMPLQADPTVKFALGDFAIKRITVPMTRVQSPYNTYQVKGLPPGPIRLPEKSTIDAVLDAPTHNYMYMCAKEDFSGYHNFSTDYNEHLANARRYQDALNARGIK